MINVSWHEAKIYAKWLSETTGKTYRLLSEAEWEYTCRAGTQTAFSFGDTINKRQAQFSARSWGSAKQTVEVGSFPANPFGLHDMHGNVWEWCEDAFMDNYQGAPNDGSARWIADTWASCVRRGGSWLDEAVSIRAADRSMTQPDCSNNSLGFRLARTLSPTP